MKRNQFLKTLGVILAAPVLIKAIPNKEKEELYSTNIKRANHNVEFEKMPPVVGDICFIEGRNLNKYMCMSTGGKNGRWVTFRPLKSDSRTYDPDKGDVFVNSDNVSIYPIYNHYGYGNINRNGLYIRGGIGNIIDTRNT